MIYYDVESKIYKVSLGSLNSFSYVPKKDVKFIPPIALLDGPSVLAMGSDDLGPTAFRKLTTYSLEDNRLNLNLDKIDINNIANQDIVIFIHFGKMIDMNNLKEDRLYLVHRCFWIKDYDSEMAYLEPVDMLSVDPEFADAIVKETFESVLRSKIVYERAYKADKLDDTMLNVSKEDIESTDLLDFSVNSVEDMLDVILRLYQDKNTQIIEA